MVDEAARRAGGEDLEAVVALTRQAIDELTPNRGGRIWRLRDARVEPVEPFLSDAVAGQDPDLVAVVGTVDDVVVGYAIMRYESMHGGSRLAVVDDIFVDPQARGIGVGEAMMDLLLDEARQTGAIGIDSLALPGDRETKNFFERYGLTARAILVHRDLRPDTNRS